MHGVPLRCIVLLLSWVPWVLLACNGQIHLTPEGASESMAVTQKTQPPNHIIAHCTQVQNKSVSFKNYFTNHFTYYFSKIHIGLIFESKSRIFKL